MRVNMEDKELVKIFNPTLKRKETILFLLIVVINGLICIDSDIGLDTCQEEIEGMRLCNTPKKSSNHKHSSTLKNTIFLVEFWT